MDVCALYDIDLVASHLGSIIGSLTYCQDGLVLPFNGLLCMHLSLNHGGIMLIVTI